MGQFSEQVIGLVARAAADQGGVISGDNPIVYNMSDPIRLWVIQLVIIIAMTQFLSLILSRIRQPRVIAEVIGGIILGPSVMGRIPHFREKVFPTNGMAGLTLTSSIGLVLFLFLVGLEIDTRVIKRNIRSSAMVSIAGLIVPLGMGAALGVGVYREFISPAVNFGYFILFTAVAIGITAFPVLCRILTELKLLDTTVGVVVLSAGVGNDVVGWILLALAVALVNASSGLTALWVLLACAGYVIFLLYPGRWAFVWLARRTGSLEQGSPTAFMMTITLIVVFASAFFTDIIGVHAIFGGFLAGLIIPHENGFAISLVEKLEDLVSLIFLPIYFILSGLNTNLGLLNTGITWGYIVIICLVAFASKFISCGAAALSVGFNWREAGAIGSLMSCKGLVELIVLNIGLQANILDPRTFSMFVVHALVLTFMTTPLTLLFYPAKYRKNEGAAKKDKLDGGEAGITYERRGSDGEVKTRFAMILDKIEQLPSAMTLSQLLQNDEAGSSLTLTRSITGEKEIDEKLESVSPEPVVSRGITIDTLRLMELTNRTSAVIRSQEADSVIYNDPVVSVYRTFGSLNKLRVTASLSIVNFDEFPAAISKHVEDSDSEMVIIPWSRGNTTVTEGQSPTNTGVRNPFDGIFHKTTTQDQTSSVVYSEFIRNVFLNAPTDVALFVDRGSQQASFGQHLFLPFFGGPDDRLALSFLVQLCSNSKIKASVVWIKKTEELTPLESNDDPKASPGVTSAAANIHMTMAAADTVYPQQNTATRLASDTADSLLWEKYTQRSTSRSPALASVLSRIQFTTTSSTKPLHTVIELVNSEITVANDKSVIIMTGRSRRMAVESHQNEFRQLITEVGSSVGSSVPRTLGDVGAALVASNVNASLLILQASRA
ncbi:Sodium/hydrogen exchanger family-domain-containing protein [Cyathus striatus]|nr:Sodium/hydrogen exchanger family-domain-containing protein [Cyathus striatus]